MFQGLVDPEEAELGCCPQHQDPEDELGDHLLAVAELLVVEVFGSDAPADRAIALQVDTRPVDEQLAPVLGQQVGQGLDTFVEDSLTRCVERGGGRFPCGGPLEADGDCLQLDPRRLGGISTSPCLREYGPPLCRGGDRGFEALHRVGLVGRCIVVGLGRRFTGTGFAGDATAQSPELCDEPDGPVLVEHRQFGFEGGEVLLVTGPGRLDVGGVEWAAADGAGALGAVELGHSARDRLHTPGDFGPSPSDGVERLDGGRLRRFEIGDDGLGGRLSPEQRGGVCRHVVDEGLVAVGCGLPSVVAQAGVARGPRRGELLFGLGPCDLRRLGQLGRSRLQLEQGIQLPGGHDGDLPRRVDALAGGVRQVLRLVQGRHQTVHSEHLGQVRAQIEAFRLGEHAAAVQHGEPGQERGLGPVLLGQQGVQALSGGRYAVDEDIRPRRAAGSSWIGPGQGQAASTGELHLDRRRRRGRPRDPRRTALCRRHQTEEREPGPLDDRRLADPVGRHHERRPPLELQLQVVVGPPVQQRQPADHSSSSMIAATSTSGSARAASTSRAIAAWCRVTLS